MIFWDASALVPMLVRQHSTDVVRRIDQQDPDILAWWGTDVECGSAIARLLREKSLNDAGSTRAWARLTVLAGRWRNIHPTPAIRTTALRLLRTHALRAGDAIQLAAAIAACDGIPSRLPFVCLDDRLRSAAEKEGFKVLP